MPTEKEIHEVLNTLNELIFPKRKATNEGYITVHDLFAKNLEDEDVEDEVIELHQYLVEKNNYIDLCKYVMTSPSFASFQTNVLQLHTGLLAYVDPESNTLRYLQGPCDFNGDENKVKPHFLFQAFYHMEGEFLHEPFSVFNRIMQTNYYFRNNNNWQNYSFIRVLNQFLSEEEVEVKKYTAFEKNNVTT